MIAQTMCFKGTEALRETFDNQAIMSTDTSNMLPVEIFLHWESTTPDAIFLRQPINGQWKTWTWRQAGDEIRRVAQHIVSMGLKPNSSVAILSKNCAHWIMADFAIMMSGHISVPIYPTLDAPTVRYILEHSDTQVLFVGKLDNFAQQRQAIAPSIKRISFPFYGEQEGDRWEDLVAAQQPMRQPDIAPADSLATIMYTSGTSGRPKGVMLTYGAIRYACTNAPRDLNLPLHPKMFSYLPLSHIAERIGVEMIGMYRGGTLAFAESLELFPKNLAEVQPTLFFAVPRLWAKFQEKILEKIPQKTLDRLLSIPVVKTIVKKSLRKKMGLTEATHIYTGAAPIALNLLLWFDKIGIEIFQAYAMTENSCYGTFNRKGANKYGTVGQPLSGIDIRIGNDDEILIKHPALLSGYYKEPGLTSDATQDGYFRTGDQGSIDADGFLTITGRVKDLFKTDKGKYVAPSPIEVKLLEHLEIEQACVVGEGIPQPIALIVLSELGRNKSTNQLIASFTNLLNTLNATLNAHEQLEKAVIVKEEWTIDNGLMTPTLKVKRNEVEKKHHGRYRHWYDQTSVVVWE